MVRGFLLVAGISVLALAASLAFAVREAAVTFSSVEAAADDARAALVRGETEAAVAALEPVRDRLDSLQARTGRADFRFAAALPVVGDPLDLVGGLTDLADRAVAVAAEVAAHGDTLLAEAVLALDDGRVDLATLAAAEAVLADLDVDGLRRAVAAVEGAGDRLVPGRVAAGRDEAVAAAHQLLDSIADGRRLLTSLQGFLGGDGPRRYFLALQNQAELRGTGGFLGVWGLLEARDGQLEMVDPASFEATDPEGEAAPDLPVDGFADPDAIERRRLLEDPERTDDPVDRSPAFALRYDHVAAGAFLGNVNVDADLPTTGDVLVRLYEDRTGDRVDGVIALTPLALQTLLAGTDSVAVPPEVLPADGSLPRRVAPEDFVRVMLVDAYNALGGPTVERQRFQQVLAAAAIEQILAGSGDAGAMARRLADVAAARQLALYSLDAAEQEAFLRLGIAGALSGADPADDLLAVTGNNAGADKSDVHVGRRYTVDLTLGTPVVGGQAGRVRMQRDATITVAVANPLDPAAHDGYIAGTTYRRDGTNVREHDGANVTWFTVWTPQTTMLRAATGADGAPAGLRNTTIHGHRALDHYLTTPANDSREFTVEVAGPATATIDGAEIVYRLRWWRQPTATTDHIDLEVTPPPGWRVADATVTTQPHLDALGPFAAAGPAETTTASDRVHVGGAVTADVDVEIRLARRS